MMNRIQMIGTLMRMTKDHNEGLDGAKADADPQMPEA
jgi:hypothetical protein